MPVPPQTGALTVPDNESCSHRILLRTYPDQLLGHRHMPNRKVEWGLLTTVLASTEPSAASSDAGLPPTPLHMLPRTGTDTHCLTQSQIVTCLPPAARQRNKWSPGRDGTQADAAREAASHSAYGESGDKRADGVGAETAEIEVDGRERKRTRGRPTEGDRKRCERVREKGEREGAERGPATEITSPPTRGFRHIGCPPRRTERSTVTADEETSGGVAPFYPNPHLPTSQA
jgi:hypothetical protein